MVAVYMCTTERRLTVGEANSQHKDKICLVCGGRLLRLAERERTEPYHWMPCGWICSIESTVFVEAK